MREMDRERECLFSQTCPSLFNILFLLLNLQFIFYYELWQHLIPWLFVKTCFSRIRYVLLQMKKSKKKKRKKKLPVKNIIISKNNPFQIKFDAFFKGG